MRNKTKECILNYLNTSLEDVIYHKNCLVESLPEDIYDFTFNRYIEDENNIKYIPIDEVIQDIHNLIRRLEEDESYYEVVKNNLPNWIFWIK